MANSSFRVVPAQMPRDSFSCKPKSPPLLGSTFLFVQSDLIALMFMYFVILEAQTVDTPAPRGHGWDCHSLLCLTLTYKDLFCPRFWCILRLKETSLLLASNFLLLVYMDRVF